MILHFPHIIKIQLARIHATELARNAESILQLEDVRSIARGEWGAVTSSVLIAARENPAQRAAWEKFAPHLLDAVAKRESRTISDYFGL